MDVNILSEKAFQTSQWSGGTTRELFIYPTGTEYKKRDFDFRISSASINSMISDFTPLNGFSRKLMILDGEIFINHENHHSKIMKKFDIDEFDGGWKTSSVGKCKDFNLITSKKADGKLSYEIIEKNQSLNIDIETDNNWLLIFIKSGNITLTLQRQTFNVLQNNLLILNNLTSNKIKVFANDNSELIFAYVKLV